MVCAELMKKNAIDRNANKAGNDAIGYFSSEWTALVADARDDIFFPRQCLLKHFDVFLIKQQIIETQTD